MWILRRHFRVFLCALAIALVDCSGAPSLGPDAAQVDWTGPDVRPLDVHVAGVPDVHTAPAPGFSEPGTLLSRLTARSYNNTVRDLLGTALRPADSFPASFGVGLFDRVAVGQSISPLFVARLAQASHALAVDTLRAFAPETLAWHFEAEELLLPAAFPDPDVGKTLHTPVPVVVPFETKEVLSLVFSVRLFGSSHMGIAPRVRLRVDGELVLEADVLATSEAPQKLQAQGSLPAGPHKFSIEVINPFWEEDLFQGYGRAVTVDWLRVEAPDAWADDDSPRSRFLTCVPGEIGEAACAREALAAFLPRAWRRPVLPAELDGLMVFVEEAIEAGRGFERGLQVAVEASLLSPHFLFFSEPEDTGTVDLHGLATRLSYFLWATMPDEALRLNATSGDLAQGDVFAAEVDRLLSDPRSSELAWGLAQHWLLAEKMEAQSLGLGGDATEQGLKRAMAEEMRLFLWDLIRTNRPIADLLWADDVFVNGSLTQFLGLEWMGRDFQHVIYENGPRGGVLRMAGVLSVLSHPTRTSPVRRGKWIAEALLCQAIPAPAMAMEFTDLTTHLKATAKEELEMHLVAPECAGCHQLMDPLGLPLERFGPLGRIRTLDEGLPIDPTATLLSGEFVMGAKGLAEVIARDPRFYDCMLHRFLTYALARVPLPQEQEAVQEIRDSWEEAGLGAGDLVRLIAAHPLFRSVPAHRAGAPL